MTVSEFLKEHEVELDAFYLKIQDLREFLNYPTNVEDESSKIDNESQYIVELIKCESENEDDYGIAVNFFTIVKHDNVTVQIDLLKSTGYIYLSKQFDKAIQANEIQIETFRKYIDWLKSLPSLVIQFFLKDYCPPS